MRYQVKAAVVGRLFLPPGEKMMAVERNGVVLQLTADARQRVREVSVTAPIPAEIADRFYSEIRKDPDGITHVKVFGDRDFSRSVRKELQLFESNFAFIYDEHPLDKIRWERWEEEFLPDNEEERQRIKVHRFSAPRKAGPPPVVVKQKVLENCFKYAPRYELLMIPMGFYREGMTAFQEERYVTAFYNFYFVIEDFFANGKTSEAQVLREFESSDRMRQFIERVLQNFSGRHDHVRNLRRFMDEEKCTFDVPGMMKFLFRVRGNLHHYFGKSPRPHATPFNQDDFEVVSLVAMFLAGSAILHRVIDINLEVEPEHPPATTSGWMSTGRAGSVRTSSRA